MRLVCAAAVCLFACGVSKAQSISGLVRDASEAPVPDAAIEVVNPALGIQREATSNIDGIFSFGNLPPGNNYVVRVTKNGFAAYEGRSIEILLGEDVQLQVRLELSTVQSEVTVIGTPIVQAAKMGVSQVVEHNQILNLPINGRRVDSYVLLTPAVVPDGNFGLVSFRGVAGGNSFLTDGNDTTNLFYYENAGRTRVTAQISQDAVQEFQVSASGYSAEFGRASGGVINTLTRSGTNELHGGVYWFFRNRTLNARDPHSDYNPPEWRHQTGVSIGGPLRQDRLFYFFNTEITRRNFPLVASLAQPPLFDSLGRFTGTCQAAADQCSAALHFLDRHFQVLHRTANSELAFGKLDWHPSAGNSVTASFNYLRWLSPNGERTQAVLTDGSGIGNNANSSVRTRYGRLSWTALPGGNTTVESRFGWFKDRLYDDLNDQLTPASTGRVQIAVAGQPNLGVGSDFPRLDPSEQRFQLAETVRKSAGRHNWTVGGDWVYTQDYRVNLSNREGTYEYATFTAFAQDFSGNTLERKNWRNYSQRFGSDHQRTSVADYSLFAQDQWKRTSKLNLTYGLRYEYEHLSQPSLRNAAYPETGRIPAPARNLAPRFSGAYMLNGKTAIRAGYGMFYARIQGGLINTLFLDNGLYQTSITLDGTLPRDLAAGPVFPNRLLSFDPAKAYGASDLSFAASNYRNAYTHQADIALDRQLNPNLGLTVTYLWSRGERLTTVRDANIGAFGPPVTYLIADGSGKEFSTSTYSLANRVDPLWRRVNVIESQGKSFYQGVAIQLRKRLSHGLQASLAYTISRAEDYGQGGGANNVFFNKGPTSLYNGEYTRDKGRSDLDQRHRLVFTSVYVLDLPNRGGRLYRLAARGWQLSQISTFASPQTTSPTVFVTGTPFPGAAFNTTVNGLGGSTRVPFLPPNSLDIDGVERTDARLTKTFALSETASLSLSFEGFNVFNHVSSTSVNTRMYNLTNGVLIPQPGLGVGVASAGYPDGTNARRAQVSVRVTF